MDLLCNLHERNNGGKMTANAQQIARACRCSVGDVTVALEELRSTGAADIYESGGLWTVVCRRMKRQAEISAKRQQAAVQSHGKTRARPDSEIEDEVQRQVEEYCCSIGLPRTDGTACFHKWQGNGWTNRGEPIRDWKATIRSWKAQGYLPSQKQGPEKSTVAADSKRKLEDLKARRKQLTYAEVQHNDQKRAEYSALTKQIEELERQT